MDCPCCHEYVDGATHRCFIQIATQDKKKRKRKRQRGPRAKRRVGVDATPEEEDDEEGQPTTPSCLL